MQKEELKDQFTDLLSKFTTYFGKYLPDDVMESLKTLSSKQQSEISKIIYDVMFDDMDLAKKRNVPICQDTGVIQYFVKCGANFPLLGDLESCLREATKRATKDAPLRHNAVEIFDERNSGDNTGVRIPWIDLADRARFRQRRNLRIYGGWRLFSAGSREGFDAARRL